MKSISELKNGEKFTYRDYLYEATNERREDTSQRYCKKLAFRMDGEWHVNPGGDWFNIYCHVELAAILVVPVQTPESMPVDVRAVFGRDDLIADMSVKDGGVVEITVTSQSGNHVTDGKFPATATAADLVTWLDIHRDY